MERTKATAVTKSICIGLPQLLAGLDIEKGHAEESDGEKQHQCVLHFKGSGMDDGMSGGARTGRRFMTKKMQDIAKRDLHTGLRAAISIPLLLLPAADLSIEKLF
jgi:hypothetical protein